MLRGALLVLAVSTAGCGRIGFTEISGDAALSDTGPDALMLGPFGPPTLVSAVSGPGHDDDPSATADLLELYFASGPGGASDLYRSTRLSTAMPWGAPQPIAELNTGGGDEDTPGVAPDGLTLWFDRDDQIFVSTRPDRAAPWGAEALVVELDLGNVSCTKISASRRRMVFCAGTLGGRSVYEAVRADPSSAWGTPVALELPSGGTDEYGAALVDDLTMIYSSNRTEGLGQNDLYLTHRPTVNAPFATLEALPSGINGPARDDDAWISPDGRTLLFSSNRGGDEDIYQATR